MYCDNSKVFIEDDDLCMSCDNYARGLTCPLLSALAQGDVYLDDSLVVESCGFYREYRHGLHVVKDEKE